MPASRSSPVFICVYLGIVTAFCFVPPTLAAANADWSTTANAIVAADGSGKYKSVQDAINAAPQLSASDKPWIIYVKPGTYKEVVYVQREKRFIKLVGDDPKTTTITYNLYATVPGQDGKPIGTFRTPSVYVDADNFACENLTFENSAGKVGQALAIRIDGDRVTFRNCRFLGWQDTILGNRGRHYFDRCYIAGAVDFIFGAATEFYDRCEIHVLGSGYVTAASTDQNTPFGFVFSHCKITAEPDVKTYLGRPWQVRTPPSPGWIQKWPTRPGPRVGRTGAKPEPRADRALRRV